MASALLHGVAIGFLIAASPGPVFFLCVRRTLARGWTGGAVSGLGVASADGFYASLAGFGITALASVLLAQARLIQLAGGLLLLYLGVTALRAQPNVAEATPRGGAAGDYFSVLALTLANPATILAFLAVFAGLGLKPDPNTASLLVAGVLLGSASWWLILATAVHAARRRVNAALARALAIVSGAALTAFGVTSVIAALFHPVTSGFLTGS